VKIGRSGTVPPAQLASSPPCWELGAAEISD
jgi:hypothetical protein